MAYEYLFALLPPLSPAAEMRISLSPKQLMQYIQEEDSAIYIPIRTILYSFDILAHTRRSMEIDASDIECLSMDDFNDVMQQPQWLRNALGQCTDQESGGQVNLWHRYYCELLEVATQCQSVFLKEWVEWVLGLDAALYQIRQSHTPYGVLPNNLISNNISNQYKNICESIQNAMNRGILAWKEMDSIIIQEKINKASELAPLYQFNDDELLSYVIQYCLHKRHEYL